MTLLGSCVTDAFLLFFAVLASLNDPLGNLWGALFETFLLLGGPRTLKLMPF